jgi:hypothetical protein
MHIYDRKGHRRAFRDMPTRFEDLKNDPYRSLAGEVRDAGGFAKSDEPFLEFLWANHFRRLVPVRTLTANPKKARELALELAGSPDAAQLPGWSGKR